MHLNELKDKKPQELLDYAASLGIENASGLKKQEIKYICDLIRKYLWITNYYKLLKIRKF